MADWNPLQDWNMTVQFQHSGTPPAGFKDGRRRAVVTVTFTPGKAGAWINTVTVDWFNGEEVIDVERRAALIMAENLRHMSLMAGRFALTRD